MLESLLAPRSIAVVGASRSPATIGPWLDFAEGGVAVDGRILLHPAG